MQLTKTIMDFETKNKSKHNHEETDLLEEKKKRERKTNKYARLSYISQKPLRCFHFWGKKR